MRDIYIVGLAHQFWLQLNNSLTFWNKLYLEISLFRLFRLIINQRNSEFFLGKVQLNGFHFWIFYT